MTKLEQVLNEKGVKQRWLASKLGLSEATITNWVKGRTKLTKTKKLALCEVLNCEIEELNEDS